MKIIDSKQGNKEYTLLGVNEAGYEVFDQDGIITTISGDHLKLYATTAPEAFQMANIGHPNAIAQGQMDTFQQTVREAFFGGKK